MDLNELKKAMKMTHYERRFIFEKIWEMSPKLTNYLVELSDEEAKDISLIFEMLEEAETDTALIDTLVRGYVLRPPTRETVMDVCKAIAAGALG